MSVDTITRVNAYFKAQIADTFPVYTIYDNDNFDLPESGDGPMVKLFVEPSIDNILTDNALYQEDGVIIAQIFVEVGESTLILHQVADDIKEAFRQVILEPEFTTENSVISFEDIEFANGGTVDKEDQQSTIQWKRWDVFVTYSKYDCSTSPFFVSTWDTENLGGTGSATKTIVLPMTAGNLVNWGDGTLDNTNTHVYATGGVKNIRIDGPITGFRFNSTGDKLKIISVSDTGGLNIDNSSMFRDCSNMVKWVSNKDIITSTSNIEFMFSGCSSMSEINTSSLSTLSVTSFRSMFSSCSSLPLIDVSKFDTSAALRLDAMFFNCMSLISLDVSKFDISNSTNLDSMFNNCESLTYLDVSGFNTSNVDNMFRMFYECDELLTLIGVEDFNISSASRLDSMLDSVPMTTDQYSTLLVNYESQNVLDNVPFGSSSTYSAGAAATARQALIDDHTWTITDGGPA